MIRLFTGLSLPGDVASALAQLKGGLPGARWIDEADYHVTLQFIGNIEERLADELHHELDRLNKSPVEVILDGVTIFGSGKPRAVVVSVRATPSLLDLHASHARVMRRVGLSVEARKYTPHVTIARLKGISGESVAHYAEARGYFRPRSFMASSFHLYSSAKSQGGGPYRIEADYSLQDYGSSSESQYR